MGLLTHHRVTNAGQSEKLPVALTAIWVLSNTGSAQLPMNNPSDPSARRAVTIDTGDGNDWGASWPGIEDAVREPRALAPSDVKRGL